MNLATYQKHQIQSFGNNSGIFSPTDIYDLTRADKFTNYGQLELIETQTISSAVAQVDFTSIQQHTYSVHLMTVNNVLFSGTGIANLRIRFFESGVVESSTVYEFAYQRMAANGTYSNPKSTAINHLRFTTAGGNGGIHNGFSNFYNLGDIKKFSFQSTQSTYMLQGDTTYECLYGGGFFRTSKYC